MAERNKSHLVITTPPQREPFKPVVLGRDGEKGQSFDGDRAAHGRRLERELDAALAPANEGDDPEGTFVTFVSFAGLELALKSLESQASGDQPELVVVKEAQTSAGSIQMATVYIPDGKKEYFLTRLSAYVATLQENTVKHAALVEGIASIRRATIRELWTDPDRLFPAEDGERRWWEVWLRHRDGNELQRLNEQARQRELPTSASYLGFADRTVLLLQATVDELSGIFESIDDLAELRWPHDIASVLTEMPASEQADWVNELRGRVQAAGKDAPAVCVVDTGVQDGHPLLQHSLHASDHFVVDPTWKSAPVYGHGTEMAGLALYGDLHSAVMNSHDVHLRHRLESVKFLPDTGENNRDLYGAVTAKSVDRPEIESPRRSRAFMLAVTTLSPPRSEDDADGGMNAGKPTSWSAAVDALAFGRAIDDTASKLTYLDRTEQLKPRLFIISAGNIRDIFPTDNHLDRCDSEPVEDPAQAWNALTVGAFTDKADMGGADPIFDGYTPLAPRGELAPTSRTSVGFEGSKWPFKPDVVAEGGNVAVSQDRLAAHTPESMAVLTTRLQGLEQRAFTTTRDTSAATAQVAALAGQIMAEYPGLRPETVRALIVHSAQWTDVMNRRLDSAPNKAEKIKLLRRYGMGVPSLSRALHSASDALTLIAEAKIRPFERDNGTAAVGRSREMNLHELPWPKAQLEALGEVNVRLRVTLSYFVEPNPSNRGWAGRYAYPSHMLRFAVRRPEDNIDTFRMRVNARARADGEKPISLGTEPGWLFGANQQQSHGSLHTDIWEGPAANLASKEAIAVYPVAGWWKDRRAYDQSDLGVHYSLIVSIESPNVEVDLWTPVALQITPEIVIET
ncbi:MULTISPECIES: S8 family peptidase [unclassified Rhodococcus (in: high G+C Gram-positive bacteria)]|uniref:S8 family peptidase n=1 Tax=unclassified Rhodococcus (in: high G+C Gram-positive bacteria) TaxID=192944 RepID=UPI00096A2A28|nr:MULTISPECIES: S8 family peptidase [unclassified Rhodococcus (in: high G+C Gram-positive bacteria)]